MDGRTGASLPDRFLDHVREAGLFDPPGGVLVAVSGGADSLALLHLLHLAAVPLHLDLTVAHVVHGIADEGDRWAERVGRAAGRLGLPVRERRLALGPDATETRARRARYAALLEMRREAGARYVATAHHADDQAETVLFRVLRGSGPAGLAGIPAAGRGGVRRPLLPFTRGELAEWVGHAHPEDRPADDPANRDERHDRVWLRHRLLPVVAERFPDARGALGAVAHKALDDRRAWNALLRDDASLRCTHRQGTVEVERGPFSGYDNALSGALLRALCRMAGAHLRASRVPAFREFVCGAPSGRSFDLGAGWLALTVFGRVRVTRCDPDADRTVLGCAWGGTDRGEAEWGRWGITWEREPAGRVQRGGWATWVTAGPGEVRPLASGDVIRPLGGVGRRPVRRLLMEARVPRPDRPTYPIVVRGARVLWIPGICRAADGVPRRGAEALRLEVHDRGPDAG